MLALTNKDDLVLDPYMGVGSSAVATVKNGRRAAGSEIVKEYIEIAKERIDLAIRGLLKTRPLDKPIYQPHPTLSILRKPETLKKDRPPSNLELFPSVREQHAKLVSRSSVLAKNKSKKLASRS